MRRLLLLVAVLALAASGCFHSFNVRAYSTSAALFNAGVEKLRRGKYADAATAFERLTLDLPARDTLLPLAHWNLAEAHRKNGEHLLAAQAFIRLSETLPDDTLADDALLMSGRAYAKMWERPTLDPQYGLLAQTQFRLLIGIYPNSTLADSATRALKRLDEWFAAKDYETAMHYARRKAYDSAILYHKDVVKKWPESDKARQAMLRLVELYRLPALHYVEDAAEMCDALRATYPTDPEVLLVCKVSPSDSTATLAGHR